MVLLTKKNFHAKNGRKMAYFSLDCRYTPELGTKSAPSGVRQKRGKTKFFGKNETHHKILRALAALAKPNCGAVKLLVELQIGISQRILHLFSRGKKPRLDNFVVLLTKKNFYAKNGCKMA